MDGLTQIAGDRLSTRDSQREPDFSGIALFSSGSVWTGDETDDDPGPTNTTACMFKNNSADDGGAIYSAAGYNIIMDSWFEVNFAGATFGKACWLQGAVVTSSKFY